MQWKETYNDLCEEISALEHRADDLSDQLKTAYQMCYDGKMPGDSFSRIPLDKALETYDSVQEKLNVVLEWLEKKRQVKAEMDIHLAKMESLENRVSFMRRGQRKSVRQIANELGYSEGHIYNVVYRMMKEERDLDGQKVKFM